MDKNIIDEVKKKREFAGLPDSIVEKALVKNKLDIKKTRSFLRKYFGVFLTNKVLKGSDENVLKSHISSKKREYSILYAKISGVVGDMRSVIDLGCGANGFSYRELVDNFGNIKYTGIEASKQLCDSSNSFYAKNGFTNARVVFGDLFDLNEVVKIISRSESPRVIFALQVVDALESVEPNFSKKLLLEVKNSLSSKDFVLVSNSLRSISGRERFSIQRGWLDDFLRENFKIVDSFELFDEKYTIIKK